MTISFTLYLDCYAIGASIKLSSIIDIFCRLKKSFFPRFVVEIMGKIYQLFAEEKLKFFSFHEE